MTENFENVKKLYPKHKELLLPDGYRCLIREQNGEDDDTLTSMRSDDEAYGINSFIAGITVWHEKSDAPLSYKDVMEMKLRSKYFILISSRIFSISNELHFDFTFEDGFNGKFVEDLIPYVPNYSTDLPEAGMPGYFKYRINPYLESHPTTKEFTLESGKRIRFKFLDGYGENYLLKLTEESRTINAELKARELALQDDHGQWYTVSSFKVFTPKDMSELRNLLPKWDERFDGYAEVKHPFTGSPRILSIIAIPDFFFPREI